MPEWVISSGPPRRPHPLDGLIVEGSTEIDTSAITGEPKPVTAKEGSHVDSGCVNMTGTIKIQVMKILSESMVSRILDSMENAVASKPKIDRFITRFSRIYTPAVVAAALLTAVVPPLFFGADWEKWIYTALTFLVISCPCALVISVPLAFFAGIGRASKDGILFKGGTVMEVIAKIKVAVMDKTGTITEGKFKVRSIIPYGKYKKEDILSWPLPVKSTLPTPLENPLWKLPMKRISLCHVENLHETAGLGVEGMVDGKSVYAGNRSLMAKAGISNRNWMRFMEKAPWCIWQKMEASWDVSPYLMH